MAIAFDAAGFRVISGNGTTDRVLHVASNGNDTSGDGTIALPFATPGRAHTEVTAGTGWQILLRRGDTFTSFFNLTKSGRSATEPGVIGAYGTESVARPIVSATTDINGPAVCGHYRGGSDQVTNVWFQSIDFRCPTPGTHTVFFWSSPGGTVNVEDCAFRDGFFNVIVNGWKDPLRQCTANFYRCLIVDTVAHNASSDGSGIYASWAIVNDYGSTYDNNGWYGSGSADNSFRAHNIYIHQECTTSWNGTWSTRSATVGIGTGTQATIDDCCVVDAVFPIQVRPAGTIARNNVILGCHAAATGTPSTNNPSAIGFNVLPQWFENDVVTPTLGPLTITGNIVCHCPAGNQNADNGAAMNIYSNTNASNPPTTIQDNIVYNWGNPAVRLNTNAGGAFSDRLYVQSNSIQESSAFAPLVVAPALPIDQGRTTFSGNRYYSPSSETTWFQTGSITSTTNAAGWTTASGESDASTSQIVYTDPTRTLATYATSLGVGSTQADFITALRLNRRGNWNASLLATAFNAYVRAGFVVGGTPPTPRPYYYRRQVQGIGV